MWHPLTSSSEVDPDHEAALLDICRHVGFDSSFIVATGDSRGVLLMFSTGHQASVWLANPSSTGLLECDVAL